MHFTINHEKTPYDVKAEKHKIDYEKNMKRLQQKLITSLYKLVVVEFLKKHSRRFEKWHKRLVFFGLILEQKLSVVSSHLVSCPFDFCSNLFQQFPT